MNIFDTVREQITVKQAAELYGIDTGRGMISCVFHNDKAPSLKLYENHYHCFGCGAHGDTTSLVAQITGLSQYEAAEQLCSAFGVVHTSEKPSIKQNIRRESQREKEQRLFRVLSDYYHMLCRFRDEYAPEDSESELHPLFAESLARQEEYRYYCDIFISGTDEERNDFIKNRKDVIEYARSRVIECTGEEEHNSIRGGIRCKSDAGTMQLSV
ncbi:MAG: CHC2 zinc finger domain-containing protein [Oscillospiraceae bacterium]|nr:CHC2 zinc finger domain-containing protein [Oscillospiraceae bacterium]